MKLNRALMLTVAVAALAAPLAAAPAVARTSMTTVTLKFHDCSGCRIAAYNTTSKHFKTTGKPEDTAKVHKGKAVFRVPTKSTRGLAFTLLSTGKYTMVGAHPNIAVDTGGIHADRWVSTQRAHDATAARRCWAGTKSHSVTIPISSFTYRVHDYTHHNKMVTSIALWASPDLRGYGAQTKFDPKLHEYPGVAQLVDQDAPYCN